MNLKYFEEFMNQEVRIRGISYKGKGRPKKSDYVTLKRKDIQDYLTFSVIHAGFTVSYANN